MLVLVDYNLFYFLISIFLNFLYLKCIFNILELNLIFYLLFKKDSVQFSLVTQSCLTLCNPMNCSTPGLPVHHQLPEFTQTHFHRVSDAIQPSHPLSSPSPPAPNLKSKFGNKEFMIWATVSSWSCFCWLYRASPSLPAENIINLISVLTIW